MTALQTACSVAHTTFVIVALAVALVALGLWGNALLVSGSTGAYSLALLGTVATILAFLPVFALEGVQN